MYPTKLPPFCEYHIDSIHVVKNYNGNSSHFLLQRAREQVHIGQLGLMRTAPPRQKQQCTGAQLFPHGSHQLRNGKKVCLEHSLNFSVLFKKMFVLAHTRWQNLLSYDLTYIVCVEYSTSMCPSSHVCLWIGTWVPGYQFNVADVRIVRLYMKIGFLNGEPKMGVVYTIVAPPPCRTSKVWSNVCFYPVGPSRSCG